MKPNLKWMPVLFTLACLSAHAVEGGSGSVGNGGGAHVCFRDAAQTQIVSAELYDLWEGRDGPTGPKLKIAAWNGVETREEIITRILTKIEATRPGVAREMRKALNFLYQEGTLIDASKMELAYMPDAKLLYVSKGCRYVQVVNWQEADQDRGTPERVLRDEDFYVNHLNPLNQAALDLHEAAYRVYRQFLPASHRMNGSTEVRTFIAEAFSNSPIIEVMAISHDINYGVHFTGRETDEGHLRSWVQIVADSKLCNTDPLQVAQTHVSGDAKKVIWEGRVYRSQGELKRGESVTEVLPVSDVTVGYPSGGGHYEFEAGTGSARKKKSRVKFSITGCGIAPVLIEETLHSSWMDGPDRASLNLKLIVIPRE